MGGAPPPPQDVAPQGPKNRKNSALLGPDFGGMQGPRIIVRQGGEGGSRPLPQSGNPGGPATRTDQACRICQLARFPVWTRWRQTRAASAWA